MLSGAVVCQREIEVRLGVQLQVCVVFFFYLKNLSNNSAFIKENTTAPIKVKDSDRKQSVCCHSAVAPQQPTSGQRDSQA